MKQHKHSETSKGSLPIGMGNNMRQMLAYTICEQNRSRRQFIPGVKFGDPIWDITLNIYTAENFDHRTTVSDLSEQSGIPAAVVARSIKYLLDQEAIFENGNQSNKEAMPYLTTEESKAAIGLWLDNCVSNLQTRLSDVNPSFD